MSDLVPADEIEEIVGARRHRSVHLGRAVSAEERVYILHPERCLAFGRDLRTCTYSVALDRGISVRMWGPFMDRTVLLGIIGDRLIPTRVITGAHKGVTLLPQAVIPGE